MKRAMIPVFFLVCIGLHLPSARAGEAAGATQLNKDEHLAGWWKFDETSGSVAKDSSKHGRHGELVGGVSFDSSSTPGRVRGALKLNGEGHQVCVAGYKGISGAGARTIAAWINTGSSKGNLVSWGAKDFGQMWTLGFIRRHVGVTPNGGYYYMAADVHDQKWRHVAVVVQEADEPNLHDDVTLYLDGEIAEIDRIGLLDLWPINTGAELDVVIGEGFNGAIDDVRIYSRALSDEEIAELYEAGR